MIHQKANDLRQVDLILLLQKVGEEKAPVDGVNQKVERLLDFRQSLG